MLPESLKSMLTRLELVVVSLAGAFDATCAPPRSGNADLEKAAAAPRATSKRPIGASSTAPRPTSRDGLVDERPRQLAISGIVEALFRFCLFS
jgi:hypothetical protein